MNIILKKTFALNEDDDIDGSVLAYLKDFEPDVQLNSKSSDALMLFKTK